MRPAVAVVTLRGGAGKSRLAGALPPADRVALVGALARHVVGVLASAPQVAQVLVVCADPAAARQALAGAAPVHLLTQPPDRPGLDAGAEIGRRAVLDAGSGVRLLVVHADLPALGTADVGALLDEPHAVTLAADRLGTGTNALVLDAPAGPFRFRFGPGSLAAHRAVAVRHGLTVGVLDRPGTAVDLDTAEDWTALPAEVRDRLTAQVPALTRLDPTSARGARPRPAAGARASAPIHRGASWGRGDRP